MYYCISSSRHCLPGVTVLCVQLLPARSSCHFQCIRGLRAEIAPLLIPVTQSNWRAGASQPSRPTGTIFRDNIYIYLSLCISRFYDFTRARCYRISRTPCLAHAQVYTASIFYCTTAGRVACCWWYIGLCFAAALYYSWQLCMSIICSQLCMLLACIYIHKQPVLQSSNSCSTPP